MDEDDAQTSNTRIVQRKRSITHLTMKTNRNIIECCNKLTRGRHISANKCALVLWTSVSVVTLLVLPCCSTFVFLNLLTFHCVFVCKEEVLNSVISFHRNDRGHRLTFPYNYLLLLKCNSVLSIYCFTRLMPKMCYLW